MLNLLFPCHHVPKNTCRHCRLRLCGVKVRVLVVGLVVPVLQLVVVHGVEHVPLLLGRVLASFSFSFAELAVLLGGSALPDALAPCEGVVGGLVLVHGEVVGSAHVLPDALQVEQQLGLTYSASVVGFQDKL